MTLEEKIQFFRHATGIGSTGVGATAVVWLLKFLVKNVPSLADWHLRYKRENLKYLKEKDEYKTNKNN